MTQQFPLNEWLFLGVVVIVNTSPVVFISGLLSIFLYIPNIIHKKIATTFLRISQDSDAIPNILNNLNINSEERKFNTIAQLVQKEGTIFGGWSLLLDSIT